MGELVDDISSCLIHGCVLVALSSFEGHMSLICRPTIVG